MAGFVSVNNALTPALLLRALAQAVGQRWQGGGEVEQQLEIVLLRHGRKARDELLELGRQCPAHWADPGTSLGTTGTRTELPHSVQEPSSLRTLA